ncbi:hypothetical protein GcM3_109027 [Golovinomyces cichoracearum]|uniref:Uncharacterized protein n=1 Tax=Golovinomyces cichoracearum TaxID=62708 RepID=A0A420I956_9PEZI|nr:hypothetical protein GcM3_109027 [Golovinomyces cichoracearum]
MQTYRPPSKTSNEESDLLCTSSDISHESFNTAENPKIEELRREISGEDIRMTEDSLDKTPSLGSAELTYLLKRLEDQEIRENNHRLEMEKMRADMQKIISIMER